MDKSVKAAQLADQIRDYLALWIVRDFPGLIITVSQVTLTPDLRGATIWVSPLNSTNIPEVLKKLSLKEGRYTHLLHRAMSRHLIPTLHFKLDDRPRIEAHFDDLLKH